MKMFNKVKFVINKILLQNSKNKKNFIKMENYNKYNYKFNSISTRKFSSFSKGQPPNDPFNKLYLLAAIFCGSLFFYKKNKK
jgi:hypothetical protein